MSHWNSKEERIEFFEEYGMQIRSMAKVFECSIHFYDPLVFIKNVVQTDIFNDYEHSYTLFSQSPYYVLEWIQEEFTKKNIQVKPYYENNYKLSKEEIGDSMHWVGYLLMYWKITRNLEGKDLLQYDLEHLFRFADLYHTEDPEVTIDRSVERKERISIKEK